MRFCIAFCTFEGGKEAARHFHLHGNTVKTDLMDFSHWETVLKEVCEGRPTAKSVSPSSTADSCTVLNMSNSSMHGIVRIITAKSISTRSCQVSNVRRWAMAGIWELEEKWITSLRRAWICARKGRPIASRNVFSQTFCKKKNLRPTLDP